MSVDLARLSALAGQVRERSRRRPEAAARRPWRITAAADLATVYIYDDIGQDVWGDGISAAEFAAEMDAIRAPQMDIRLNSRGGLVFDGIAMYETIKRHPADKTAIVDGVAASAASVIMLAADRVRIAPAGRVMIHDASGGVYLEGSATEIRAAVKDVEELADLLDSLSNSLAEIYVEKAGGTVAQWRAVMSSDKWYNATEALQAGLVDQIGDGPAEDKNTSAQAAGTISPEATLGVDAEALRNLLKGAFTA